MRYFLFLLILVVLSDCSLNKDSKYWTEDVIKNDNKEKQKKKILKKSGDITTMTLQEYEIYIDEYTKKSKYPDISQ
tara:strand:- start:253 stop:480 length:228 start_codon:yes stop_codon:yes gene_type:complete